MRAVTFAITTAVLLSGCVAYPESEPYANYYNEPYYDPYYPGFGYFCCFGSGFRHRHFRDHDHDGGGSQDGVTAGGGRFVNPPIGPGGLGDMPHGRAGAGGPGTTPGPGTTGGGTYIQPGGRR